MSDYLYNTWLSEYPFLMKDLDNRYGGPSYNKKAPLKGRNMLIHVLYYLSIHKQQTCEHIAEKKYNDERESKVKLKSVTDYVRKFIENNLIPRRIVKEDGFEIKYNKKVSTYSLTPFGILYSIHLFSKDSDTILNNLSRTYKNDLPNVFGKFDLFKKKLGKNFLKIIGLQQIAEAGDTMTSLISTTPPEALMDLTRDTSISWSGDRITDSNRWTKQLSLMVYSNILSYFYNKSLNLEYTIRFQKMDRLQILRGFWEKFLEGEEDIRKWYFEFIEKAVVAYTRREKGISEMRSCLTVLS